jgi:CHAT domain-containing protein
MNGNSRTWPKTGAAKDEALRTAMAAMAKQPGTAFPYHWASFTLIGDPENRNLTAKASRKCD